MAISGCLFLGPISCTSNETEFRKTDSKVPDVSLDTPKEMPAPNQGNSGGNGGNPAMELWFKKAKEKLPQMFQSAPSIAKREFFPKGTLEEDIEWIQLNLHYKLSEQISLSPLVWTNSPQERCGFTTVGALQNPISLYYPKCLTSVKGIQSAAEVLIHESIHHLGIAEEDRTDRLTSLISLLIGDSIQQDQRGIFNPAVEGDFVCYSSNSPKKEGDWKLVIEEFNGASRARLYRWDGQHYQFQSRGNCHPTELSFERLRCSEFTEALKNIEVLLAKSAFFYVAYVMETNNTVREPGTLVCHPSSQ